MKINYPNPSLNKRLTQKDNSIKTHGMLFENDLNISNEYYLSQNIAIIHKKPTPIQIVKVDYPKRSSAKIVEAYYKTPSTTDYNGIYKGKYIDYEAKETVKTYFPFAHIFPHQIKHLENVNSHGGLAFIIIYFRISNEVIIINITDFLEMMEKGKKSVTIEEAHEVGEVCPQGYAPPINYLKAVDKIYNI